MSSYSSLFNHYRLWDVRKKHRKPKHWWQQSQTHSLREQLCHKDILVFTFLLLWAKESHVWLKFMLCSAISNSSPFQSENLALNIILCKSLKYGLIMVSVKNLNRLRLFSGKMKERRKNANDKKKTTENKLRRKIHWEETLKQFSTAGQNVCYTL